MTFEDAVKKMIKQYFAGLGPDELKKSSGKKPKYTKKFFDKVAKDHEIDQTDLNKFGDSVAP